MSAEQLRRTKDVIVFVREHRPLRLAQIGYHEISPWAREVGLNPLFGSRYKGKIRLRL